jgi:hypothetical protein
MKENNTDRNKAQYDFPLTFKATRERPYKEFDPYVELTEEEIDMDENNWGEKELLEHKLSHGLIQRKSWTFDELFEYNQDYSNYKRFSTDKERYFRIRK